jgi:hypothetical protein
MLDPNCPRAVPITLPQVRLSRACGVRRACLCACRVLRPRVRWRSQQSQGCARCTRSPHTHTYAHPNTCVPCVTHTHVHHVSRTMCFFLFSFLFFFFHAHARAQAAYDAAPMLPPDGSIKGPCLLGSLAHFVDDFDWGGVCVCVCCALFVRNLRPCCVSVTGTATAHAAWCHDGWQASASLLTSALRVCVAPPLPRTPPSCVAPPLPRTPPSCVAPPLPRTPPSPHPQPWSARSTRSRTQ